MRGQRAISSGHVFGSFNEDLQVDLLFWRKHIVIHMLDSCIRWSQAEIVPTKETGDFLEFITLLWIRQYGPPKTITSDNDGGPGQ